MPARYFLVKAVRAATNGLTNLTPGLTIGWDDLGCLLVRVSQQPACFTNPLIGKGANSEFELDLTEEIATVKER